MIQRGCRMAAPPIFINIIKVDSLGVLCYYARRMKRTAVRGWALLGAVVVMVGCQQVQLWSAQAEYDREHAEDCLKKYHSHVKELQSAAEDLRKSLPQAVRAEWHWVYDCDACDEALLPAPVKLSRAEFEQVVALLGQAEAMPPLPQESFMTEAPRLSLDSAGNILRPVLMEPWLHCCGGVAPVLEFFDAEGNEVCYWDESMTVPVSRVPEYRAGNAWAHPRWVMPDAAYEQLQALPSVLAVKKKDNELQKTLKHLRGGGSADSGLPSAATRPQD